MSDPNPLPKFKRTTLKYETYKVLNKKSGRRIPLYRKGTRQINPLVKKLLKEDISNIADLPKEFVIDRANKSVVRKFDRNGRPRAEFKQLLEKPQQIKYSKNEDLIFNRTNRKFYKRSDVLDKKGKVKKYWKERGFKVLNNVIIGQFTSPFKKFGKEFKKQNGLVRQQIFTSPTDITTFAQFLQSIKDARNQYFSTIPLDRQKVLIKIGTLFRWIPMTDIFNMTPTMFENSFDTWGQNPWGSDTTYGETDLVQAEYVDKEYFMISNLLPPKLGAFQRFKTQSKYWKCEQPITKNNTCVEGAINRGLKLGLTTKKMREMVVEATNNYIKEGQQIKLTDLHLYEDIFKCRIKVYEDTSHVSTTYLEPNLILDSEKTYEPLVKILWKDNHANLIVGKKLQIGTMSTAELKLLGIKKNKQKKINKKVQEKKEEMLVVFDIETIFDKENYQFLKPYGVSWFVWDASKPFNYDEAKHLKPPFCYYESGEGCMLKFLEFLISPPENVKYKPIGYNNSRFDNFALCEVALQKGLLRNVFYADGSILYTIIGECEPTWDACRFLTGQSLDGACRNYNTNPRKRKDLIDHYTIQCYYEAKGMSGLTKLLEEREELVLYNKLDCLCLLDLTLKMRQSYLDLFNVDVLESITLSSMGYKICRQIWEDKNIEIQPALTYEHDRFFRDSLTAGRTQSFYGRYDYQMPLAMGDIKSLYPTVMGNYDNNCPYPYGRYEYTKTEKVGKLGIYRVNIKHQRCRWKNEDKVYSAMKFVKDKYGYDLYREYAPNVIAKREKDKPLDWFFKDEIPDVKLTSVDIDVLREATGDYNCVEILEGYYWEDSRTDIFIHYLDPPRLEKSKQDRLKEHRKNLKKINPDMTEDYYKSKMEEVYGEDYNEAKREGCKGISNSLSGKLLEAIHTDVYKMFSVKDFIAMEKDEGINELEIIDFGNGFSMLSGKKTEEDSFNAIKEPKPSYLGMFVYSYARRLMYNKILGRYLTLYMDTDSACMPLCEWDRLNNEYDGLNFVNTGEYGCIEEEVCEEHLCDECKKNPSTKPMINGKRCPDCVFTPADRIIAIAPKNYMVENTKCDYLSKRKFKGVRKNDFWLPLSHFADDEKDAIDYIHTLSQDDIRRFRENKCCKDCVEDLLIHNKKRCEKCEKGDGLMKKTYSTEMFKELESGRKIAVFCSMINRIKFKVSNVVEWEFQDRLEDKQIDIKDLEFIINGYKREGEKQPISIKFNVDAKECEEYFDQMSDMYIKAKQIKDKRQRIQMIKDFFTYHRKFQTETNTRMLTEVFKLKQQYLVKVI